MFQLSWRETLTLTMLTPTGILNRLYSLDQDGLAYAYLIMILLQVTVEHAHHAVAVFIANLHSPFSNSTATSSLIRVCLIGTASPGEFRVSTEDSRVYLYHLHSPPLHPPSFLCIPLAHLPPSYPVASHLHSLQAIQISHETLAHGHPRLPLLHLASSHSLELS